MVINARECRLPVLKGWDDTQRMGKAINTISQVVALKAKRSKAVSSPSSFSRVFRVDFASGHGDPESDRTHGMPAKQKCNSEQGNLLCG